MEECRHCSSDEQNNFYCACCKYWYPNTTQLIEHLDGSCHKKNRRRFDHHQQFQYCADEKEVIEQFHKDEQLKLTISQKSEKEKLGMQYIDSLQELPLFRPEHKLLNDIDAANNQLIRNPNDPQLLARVKKLNEFYIQALTCHVSNNKKKLLSNPSLDMAEQWLLNDIHRLRSNRLDKEIEKIQQNL
jgi:hypothetical protein